MNVKHFVCLAVLSGLSVASSPAADAPHNATVTNGLPVKSGNPPSIRPSLNPEAGFTPEQTKAYKAAIDGSHEQMGALWQKLRTDRRELDKLATTEKADESAIRSKAADLGRTEGDLAVLKSKTLSQLRPHFSAPQMERLARNPQLNGAPYMPSRSLSTNEMKLRPQVPHSTNSVTAPIAPAVK